MAKKNSGLGRGLDSLIPTSLNVEAVAAPGESIKQLSLDTLYANPDQPRKTFDEQALTELAASLKEHGVIQPIVATPDGEGRYRIVAGERRFRAAGIAKLKKVPVIVRDHKELEELEVALVENVQRVDLSPLEQAVSIVRLHDQFSMSFKQIAKKLGKAETTISNMIRLLQLPELAITAMQKNQISEGHARAILALKTDEKAQIELLNNIITQGWSVRAAEAFVKEQKSNGITASTAAVKLPSKYVKRLEKLPDSVGRRAIVKPQTAKKGRVTISYDSIDQLEELLGSIEKLKA